MNKFTQKQRILDYLQKHKTITQKDAIKKFGAYRLSAIVYDLKKDGYDIKTNYVTSKNRYGEHTTFAAYELVEAM